MKKTLYNNFAQNPCAYCRLKKCNLTVKQVKEKKCLSKNCWHLKKNEDHEWWAQRDRAKAKKKDNKQIEMLLI